MPGLDWAAVESAGLNRDPFDHVAIPQVLQPACAAVLPDDFPAIRSPGSFSLTDAPPGPALRGLIDDLVSDRFRGQMERIFDIDLDGRPVLVTLRGQCSQRDGAIHTDSTSKILSLLLYLNVEWPTPLGRLLLLRDGRDLGAGAIEIPATLGSMVAFRRSDRSWHGHSTYSGQRRVLQVNYLTSARASLLGTVRHRFSALAKKRVA
jgi:SM-20-related protein